MGLTGKYKPKKFLKTRFSVTGFHCVLPFLQVGHTSSACEMLGKRRQVSKNYQETVTCKLIKMRLHFSALVETHKSQT